MTLDKQSVDYMRQALSAINLVEEPVTYQEYLDNQTEDGHTDTDSMQAKTAQIAKDAMALYQMFKNNPGDEEIMTWITNKLAVAADKIQAVKNYLENPTTDAPMENDLEEKHGGEHSTTGREMTKGEMDKREKIVKKMKSDKAGFKKRYGKDADAVMYATATKMAMKDDVESIGESTMNDKDKKTLSEGISIQTDSLEDQIALMAILKNAGLDPQQMNIQQKAPMNAPAPDMTPDTPIMDKPEEEAYDNQPDEKYLDKDDYELKRNKVPNKDMGPSAASRGDNPLPENVEEARELGRVDKTVLAKLMKELDGYKSMIAGETDRDDKKMYKERLRDLESMIKNVTRGRPIDTALQDELSDMYDAVKGVKTEAKHAKPDYIDLDGDGDKEESMKKAAKDKEAKEKSKKEDASSDTETLIAELNKQYELMLIGGKQAQLGLTASARVIADETMYDGSRFVVAEVVGKGEEGLVAEDGAWDGETTPYRVAYHIREDEIIGQVGSGQVPYLSKDGNGSFPVKHKLNNLDLNDANFFENYVEAVDKIKAMYEDLGEKMFGEVTTDFGGCEMIRHD